MTNAFGSALRQHRQRAGHSQLELALRAGCTQKQLSFLETGRTRPRIGTVQRLCDALSSVDTSRRSCGVP
ncbi:MAG: helix-turn-helix domain-containing protein [Myxococcales bacterium]|nr:helix-turn-helix domain-containing protein [Myxococcales bacterium]